MTGAGALGVASFEVSPVLTLIAPPADALTNDPKPAFVLGYGAQCNGSPCSFDASYVAGLALTAALNGQAIGDLFVFDPDTRQAAYAPGTRLPEGENTFTAQVKDAFGHPSNTVTNTFTVDTIAPRFLSLGPEDGSVFHTAEVAVEGTVDDPRAMVILDGVGPAVNPVASDTTLSFRLPVTLRPGINTLHLSALDRAGNVGAAMLSLTYIPVSVTIGSPQAGTVIDDDLVTVSGQWQGPAGTQITVNGFPATLTADTLTAADIPLKPGANTLTVTATTPQGYTATQTVTVTSTNTGPSATTWTPAIPLPGPYQVYARWVAAPENATNAVYTVVHAGGATPVTVNQQQDGGQWNLFGTFNFAPNQNHHIVLNDVANGRVVADAVKLVPQFTQEGPLQVYNIHPDHLNTPRVITDQQQRVVWRWDNQDPFGGNIPDEDPDQDGQRFVFNPRFPGQYFDKETNLHYNYFRDYDPAIGRYIQSDLIGLAGGANTYVYVGGNPLSKVDPLGLAEGCDFIPDALETPCRLRCCDRHDRCWTRHRCDLSSWYRLTPACLNCNLDVIECFIRCNKQDCKGDKS